MSGVAYQFAAPLLFLMALLGVSPDEPTPYVGVTVYVHDGERWPGIYGLSCDPRMESPLCPTDERRIDLWWGSYVSTAMLKNMLVHEAEHQRNPYPADDLDDPYARYREADAYRAGCEASWVPMCDPWLARAAAVAP